MRILSVETSCDETAVALLEANSQSTTVLHQEISSQIASHKPYGGVVPEIAVREHLDWLPRLTARLLENSNIGFNDIDSFAVTRGPGLASSLMIGLTYTKTLALATDKPWFAVNHLEGHLYSPFLSRQQSPRFPHLALIISGGHTLLLLARDNGCYEKIGGTRDDAAGEAFDKVAKLLGLGYPGGPEIERLARDGDPKAFHFPRGLDRKDTFDFSFSGLKTAMRNFLQEHQNQPIEGAFLADVCASFQQSVIDILLKKSLRAATQSSISILTVSGGVSCNRALAHAFSEAGAQANLDVLIAPPHLSTDNAAMIGAVAAPHLLNGKSSNFDIDVDPNLRIEALT